MAKRRGVPRGSIRRKRKAQVEFNPDYTYVKQDLRRIATLAGTFITLMVILAFFLR